MTTGNLNDSGYPFKLYLLHYLYWIRRTIVLWLYSCPKLPTHYVHENMYISFFGQDGEKGIVKGNCQGNRSSSSTDKENTSPTS